MAKKKANRGTGKAPKATPPADAITEEKLLGYFPVAYVLDAVELLDPQKSERLDSLQYPNCPSWRDTVESSYGINRTFVRSVYALCTEVQTPPVAVAFILRGLECPNYQERLAEVLELGKG